MDNWLGIPKVDRDLAMHVRTLKISGDAMRSIVSGGDLQPLAEKIKAITPTDVSLYLFATDGGPFVPSIHPSSPPYQLSTVIDESSPNGWRVVTGQIYSDDWEVGICSKEFDPLPEPGGVIPLHDKEIV